jgi:hypothetical protein
MGAYCIDHEDEPAVAPARRHPLAFAALAAAFAGVLAAFLARARLSL